MGLVGRGRWGVAVGKDLGDEHLRQLDLGRPLRDQHGSLTHHEEEGRRRVALRDDVLAVIEGDPLERLGHLLELLGRQCLEEWHVLQQVEVRTLDRRSIPAIFGKVCGEGPEREARAGRATAKPG